MSKETLLEYELSQAKVVNALQAIGIKKAEIDSSHKAFLESQRLQQKELSTLVVLAKEQESALRALQEEFQATTGIDVQKMVYDDKTGKISFIGNN